MIYILYTAIAFIHILWELKTPNSQLLFVLLHPRRKVERGLQLRDILRALTLAVVLYVYVFYVLIVLYVLIHSCNRY